MGLSAQVGQWLADTSDALRSALPLPGEGPVGSRQRFESLRALGTAASDYRKSVYLDCPFSGTVPRPVHEVTGLLDDALAVIDHCIRSNRRENGTYNAYNLLHLKDEEASVGPLYLMLEGQVAALSSGAIPPEAAADLVETLFESDIYRPDQHSFMLYPDRPLPGFLEKNRVPDEAIGRIPLLRRMTEANDERIVTRDAEGSWRFSADFRNVRDLDARLDALSARYGNDVEASRKTMQELYESVFRHREFTGRSGTMFGFEGLGCIYWHMVSKLLLSVQENFFAALDANADQETCRRLGALYYRVRDGLGFNKTPGEYGAFPTDPYSHTPGHGGAQQPGMTGQVKEEVLSRFGELGLRVAHGELHFDPRLLRTREFLSRPRPFRFLDIDGRWQELTVPASGLAFTWCQVPFVYQLRPDSAPWVSITLEDGSIRTLGQLALPAELSSQLFRRSGYVRQVVVSLPPGALLGV